MFDRSGLPVKEEFAAALRSTKFFICPRGNGVGSIRLFETMKAARVPVIISDEYVAPEGIDWANCSIRIREREIRRLPAILREREPDFKRLATNARSAWENNFSEKTILSSIGRLLQALIEADRKLSMTTRLKTLVYPAVRKIDRAVERLRT